MDYSPPGSFLHRIFRARIREWVAISFFTGSSWPRVQTCISCIGKSHLGCPCLRGCSAVLSCFSPFWLCDPWDYSWPGSSLHGIFQARIREWVAISFFTGSSWPMVQTCISCIGKSHLGCPWLRGCSAVLSCFSPFWLCDPWDYSWPGSSLHGIFQARTLSAISFSRGSFRPRDQSCFSYISCIGTQILYH